MKRNLVAEIEFSGVLPTVIAQVDVSEESMPQAHIVDIVVSITAWTLTRIAGNKILSNPPNERLNDKRHFPPLCRNYPKNEREKTSRYSFRTTLRQSLYKCVEYKKQ